MDVDDNEDDKVVVKAVRMHSDRSPLTIDDDADSRPPPPAMTRNALLTPRIIMNAVSASACTCTCTCIAVSANASRIADFLNNALFE